MALFFGQRGKQQRNKQQTKIVQHATESLSCQIVLKRIIFSALLFCVPTLTHAMQYLMLLLFNEFHSTDV